MYNCFDAIGVNITAFGREIQFFEHRPAFEFKMSRFFCEVCLDRAICIILRVLPILEFKSSIYGSARVILAWAKSSCDTNARWRFSVYFNVRWHDCRFVVNLCLRSFPIFRPLCPPFSFADVNTHAKYTNVPMSYLSVLAPGRRHPDRPHDGRSDEALAHDRGKPRHHGRWRSKEFQLGWKEERSIQQRIGYSEWTS